MERIYSLMKDYPDYTGTIKTYLGMDDNITAQGVLGNIQTLIRRIFTGCFGKKMVAGDFSMRRIIREKGAVKVFLEFDPAHSDALSPGYSALLDVGISEAESIGRGNTYIIVDEAALIPYCKRYSEAPNLGRSQGLKMIVGLQNIHQFVESFGEAKSKSILAGFVNAFCLRSTDADTRRYVCERFGSTDTAGHDAFAIRDADIRALEDGECFVDIAKTSPFRFKPDEHYD